MTRGYIGDSINHALDSRLLGSSVFQSSDSLLDQLLSLHYRVHYHIHIPSKTKRNALSTLLTEVQKLPTVHDELHLAIVDNIYGILYCELDDKEKGLKYVSKKVGNIGKYDRFSRMLELERLYYEDNVDLAEFCSEKWTIPKYSDGLTWHYLQVIIKELDLSNLKPKNLFQWLLSTLSGTATDSNLLSYGHSILKKSRFPNADESNDYELEQFHMVLQEHLIRNGSNVKKEWEQFIIESMEKSFQSIPVSKSAMLFYQKVDPKRSVLNFTNLVNYSEKHFELNKRYPDLIDLVSSYQFILSTCQVSYEPFFNPTIASSNFLQLLQRVHKKYSIPIIEKQNALEGASDILELCLAPLASSVLSNSWKVLYEISAGSLSSLLDHSQIFFLSNSLQTSISAPVSLKFKFAYHLANLRQIDLCITYLKKQILTPHPEHFASWHLLALCESCINEDLQVSFKIVNSVIQSMCELFDENKYFSIDEKWQFIHIKLTQIQLVRDMFALEDALEILPEVFELYHRLFANESETLGSEYNKSNDYLLQSIWLFALELYLENDDMENVQEALDEFKNVTSKYANLNHNLAQGFVFLTHGHFENAMAEFEKVLHYDFTSVEALLGMAKVILKDEEISLDEDLKHSSVRDPRNRSANLPTSLEASSAVARLKFLFEQLVDKSIEGHQTSAVWWYLSKIYEIYNDSNRQQEALWQCVKFEELQPVREFKFCNF
ncbi:unnamed protein product [Kluyveromyces dobzhanskii CBS 2104]|uniref:Cargo-transport protein YPP1 n=1 Tax=Kluyveromyces dobzhanskii CBS 2104 TaxID=1427455 RepID=A0A0A8LDH1_9SACH|nr:unnamed protein product [Kluyveromyces dobzhanskii CBS 2104]